MKYVKAIYATILLFVFIYVEIKFVQTNSQEVGLFLVWTMTVLTIPLGALWPLLLSGLGMLISVDKLAGHGLIADSIFLFFLWLGMAAIGYWQWFTLLPKIVRRLKRTA